MRRIKELEAELPDDQKLANEELDDEAPQGRKTSRFIRALAHHINKSPRVVERDVYIGQRYTYHQLRRLETLDIGIEKMEELASFSDEEIRQMLAKPAPSAKKALETAILEKPRRVRATKNNRVSELPRRKQWFPSPNGDNRLPSLPLTLYANNIEAAAIQIK